MRFDTAKQWSGTTERLYYGVDLFPYQLAFGISLRWLFNRPHIRLYFGPIKLYAGGLESEAHAFEEYGPP